MTRQDHDVEQILGPLNEVEKKNAPKRLYLAGNRGVLTLGPRVAIVGSRKASKRGLEEAWKLSEALASRGIVVVSGLAEGIDTAAHGAAMEVRGSTVAVLGTPLDECYPPKNRSLQDRIMREHLAVSQFPPGIPTRPSNFPIRNRTMALLSDATVIVEAGEKSGSLHQGWEALRLGRALFLMESVVNKGLTWTEEMMRYGAEPLVSGNLELLFESIPERARGDASQPAF
jgi:DNA processing protein